MTLEVNGAMLTDPGRHRTVNEDWCGSIAPDEEDESPHPVSVWVVADGVGGFGTGREASQIAVETVLRACSDLDEARAEAQLREAIERANQELVRRSGQTGRQYQSTMLAAVVIGNRAWFANVGDCRAYMLRSHSIVQLTRDHTWVAEQVALGRLRPEEAAGHPKSNVITRCLGQRASVRPDVVRETLRSQDRVVLCSDGLTRHVPDDDILRIGASGEPPAAARRLIDLANQRGGTDNVTVAVVELMAATAPGRRPERQRATAVAQTDTASRRLAALQLMSQRINVSLDVGETLRSVMDSLVEMTGAERGFVMLLDEQTNRLRFQIGRNVDARTVSRDPEISRSIVDKVFRECRPLLIGDAVSDPEFRESESVILHALRSVMCAPLAVKGKAVGVVYVDNSLSSQLFTQADVDLVSAFANIAAPAIENARLHQRLAAQVREISAMKTTQDRILRSVSSGIVSVDRDGTIISFNRAAAEMLAVSIDSAIGRRLDAVLPPRFLAALGPLLGREGQEPGMTIQGLDMEGELRGRGYVHLRHRLSPLRDEGGATVGYVLVLDDYTEREQLERARREAAAEREQIKSVFEHYMAPAVFQELIRQGPGRSGIGGDARDLTVLFADIRGFTSFSEDHRPEQVVEMLNAYLGAATKIIFDHEGTIDKFIGDAIMALFGAPLQIANHPLQAIKAALGMQRQFAQTPSRRGDAVHWGIGINTGLGVVGTIGAPELMSYTAIGDVVNVAARLQGEAREDEILITADTYERVRDHVEVQSVGRMDLKGRKGRVNVFKVTSLHG
jgi:PAS domain S-box-containing protein